MAHQKTLSILKCLLQKENEPNNISSSIWLFVSYREMNTLSCESKDYFPLQELVGCLRVAHNFLVGLFLK